MFDGSLEASVSLLKIDPQYFLVPSVYPLKFYHECVMKFYHIKIPQVRNSKWNQIQVRVELLKLKAKHFSFPFYISKLK